MAHLMRTVPREALATHERRADATVLRGAAVVLDLPPWVGEYVANMEGPDKECSRLGMQMALPLRHGAQGRCVQPDGLSDAAFVAGAGQAERNLKGLPAALCPLQSASGASVRERSSNFHHCNRRGLNGTENRRTCYQCVVPHPVPQAGGAAWGAARGRRMWEHAWPAAMLSGCECNISEGQRDAARLCSASRGPAGAFLTAIPSGRMTLGIVMLAVSVGHQLGHHVPANVTPTAV